MPVKKGFQVDRRVGIAMDALSARQQAVLKPVLEDKEHFIALAKRPGVTEKLSAAEPLYTMKAGAGMRVIFTVQEENIVVLDLMRKVTMDRLVTKKTSKPHSAKKSTGKGDQATKVRKV